MSGEVYTWGTRARPAAGRGARSAAGVAGAQPARCATPTRSWPCPRAIRDEFLAAGVPPQKVALIPHGVDTERFRPATPDERAALRGSASACPPSGRIVIYTGRLLRGKGLEDAARRLRGCRGRRARRPPRARGLRRRARRCRSRTTLRGASRRPRPRGPRHLHRPRGRRRGLPARLRRVRVPVGLRGPRHLAGRGGGVRPARGRLAHGRHRGRHRGRAVGLAGSTPGDVAALATALRALVARSGAARRAMGRPRATSRRARFDERDAVDRYRALFREAGGAGRPHEGRAHRRHGLHRRAAAGARCAPRRTRWRALARAGARPPAAAAEPCAGSKGDLRDADGARAGWSKAPTPSSTSPPSTAPPAIPTRTTATSTSAGPSACSRPRRGPACGGSSTPRRSACTAT